MADQVRSTADDCRLTLFECSNRCEQGFRVHESSSTEYVRRHVRRMLDVFETWRAFSGAGSRKGMSLDDRLTNHPSLRAAVHGLLHTIQEALEDASSLEPADQAEVPAPRTTPLDITHLEAIRSKWRSYKGRSWEKIRAAIETLLDIAFSIRNTVPAATSYLDGHYRRDDDEYFLRVIQLFLGRRFPNARPSLQEQLAKSIYIRRKRLLYQQRREEKLSYPRTEYESTDTDMVTKSEELQGDAASLPHVTEQRPSPAKYIQTAPASTVISNAANPHLFQVRHPASTIGSKPSLGTSPPIDETLEYPPLPRCEEGKDSVDCPFCSRPILAREIARKNKFWIPHIHEDLQPWVCFSERCQDPARLFARKSDWQDHMKVFHGPNWSLTIHMMSWYCDREHELREFGSKNELKKHLEYDHSGYNEFLVLALLSRNKRVAERGPRHCPLHETIPKSLHKLTDENAAVAQLLEDHIAEDLLKLAFLALPNTTKEDTESSGGQAKSQCFSKLANDRSAASRLSHTNNVLNSNEDIRFEDEPIVREEGPEETSSYRWVAERNTEVFKVVVKEFQTFPGDDKHITYWRENWADLKLRDRLLRARIRHMNGREEFWPDQILIQALTRDCVMEDFDSLRTRGKFPELFSDHEVEWYVDHIAPKEDMRKMLEHKEGLHTTPDDKTSPSEKFQWRCHRKIFAILTICQLKAAIMDFIGAGVCDSDLPLIETEAYGRTCLAFHCSPSVDLIRPEPGASWTKTDFARFCAVQYQFLTPYLARNSDSSDGIPHYIFPKETILPFESETITKRSTGGFGTISCIKIPSASHGFGHIKQVAYGNGWFALKTMNTKMNAQDFQRERNMLALFSGTHDHLITLLMTYVQDNRFHLLFPWADCDLEQYWERTRSLYNPTQAQLDGKRMHWVSAQIVGLVSALHMLHNPDHLHAIGDKRYARHGDIKPENVLAFIGNQEREGLFVLGDLGLASMYRGAPQSNIPIKAVPVTPNYRPPECDQEGGAISRAFDIWTMGCLLLDMVCWILGGVDLIREFEEKRSMVLYFGVRSPTYYEIKKLPGGGYIIMIKGVVEEWFSKLHRHPGCTEYLHDLLDLIQDQMIVVLSQHRTRIRSAQLLQKLQELHMRVDDPPYGLFPSPWKIPLRYVEAVETTLNEMARQRAHQFRGVLEIYDEDGLGPARRPVEVAVIDTGVVVEDTPTEIEGVEQSSEVPLESKATGKRPAPQSRQATYPFNKRS